MPADQLSRQWRAAFPQGLECLLEGRAHSLGQPSFRRGCASNHCWLFTPFKVKLSRVIETAQRSRAQRNRQWSMLLVPLKAHKLTVWAETYSTVRRWLSNTNFDASRSP